MNTSSTPTLDKYTYEAMPENTYEKNTPWYVAGFGALGQIGSSYFQSIAPMQTAEQEQEKRKQRNTMITLVAVALTIGVVIYFVTRKK